MKVKMNNGGAPRQVDPFEAADVAAMALTTSITVTIDGAGKCPRLREIAGRLAHFSYVFGYVVTAGEVTGKKSFKITLDGLIPGTAPYWAVILYRIAGRQVIKPDPLVLQVQRSRIRTQWDRQWIASVCLDGSDLRNATDAEKMQNQDYVDHLYPLHLAYGLYQHGSVPLPV